MKLNIISIASGIEKTYVHNNNTFKSSYKKNEFYNYIDVNEYGILNDNQSDKIYHGGIDKAIHIGSASHFNRFKGIDKLSFGCNIFVDNVDEGDINVGDLYSIGDILIEVSQPRQPCWKIEAIFDKSILRYIQEEHAVGWYVRVLSEGIIDINDDMILKNRVSDISIKQLSIYLKQPPTDVELINKIMNMDVISKSYKDSFIKACYKLNKEGN